ncbi:MAG TPA: kynureninase [Acidimicrobiia bacterium]|nr:kynureninase [Acidimicrobiia bacterium]
MIATFRDRFHIPVDTSGREVAYLCGHSLGLAPKAAAQLVETDLRSWAEMGVEGHLRAEAPWYGYHELVRLPLAQLVGAHPDEVVAMNSLTANIHLLMVSFFRPDRDRYQILMEANAFSSDTYAVVSQLRHHQIDERQSLVVASPRPGEDTIRTEDVVSLIHEHRDHLALVMMAGVNYLTGQFFDLAAVTAAAHHVGAVMGVDLAHAVGNVPLRLHDWGVDFAAWCSYKYLNGGPGAVAGAFVHRRHGWNPEVPRFAGWWGTDPETRFEMSPEFRPRPGADGWQLSNPPILGLAPLRASLEIFDEASMTRLRERSVELTGYLQERLGGRYPIITPRDPEARGCQLSLRVGEGGGGLLAKLEAAGVVVDFRPPDVIRVAPVPLYNTEDDVDRLVAVLETGRP